MAILRNSPSCVAGDDGVNSGTVLTSVVFSISFTTSAYVPPREMSTGRESSIHSFLMFDAKVFSLETGMAELASIAARRLGEQAFFQHKAACKLNDKHRQKVCGNASWLEIGFPFDCLEIPNSMYFTRLWQDVDYCTTTALMSTS